MPRLVLAAAVLGTLTGAARLSAADRALKVPPGFEVVKVAGPPLVDRPIVADFDDHGRLYVADSSGSNENVQKQLKDPTHRVVRLEDTNADGVFDKSVVFADKMMFPEGAMWLAGSLYVAAPPHIWKLTDTNDDGIADKREVWFDGKTLTGCANDLHGPYRGPDGYIYWCKGAFAKQEYTLPNGKKFTTRAAHVFRAKPDGTGIEPVMTGGMDNPVDVVFTPGGERIFSTTFFRHPGEGQRDGLVHAVYGGIYGKDHDPIRDPDHKWTGPHLMPVLTHLGPAAPAGLHRYESDQFGRDYRDNLFCAQFNLRTVSRHVLVPKGSTFETKDSPFVTSDDVDFHPTDVLEDADGSLLVIDTGGWYKLCCPTSQLVKPDELGGIYRVRKAGAHKVADPRGRKVNWGGEQPGSPAWREPRDHLGDRRPAVRRAAIERMASLAARTDDRDAILHILRVIQDGAQIGPDPDLELAALAVLTRIDSPAAREATRLWLDPSNVRSDGVMTAAHSAGLWRDKGAVPRLGKLLADRSHPLRRAAAEALGRIGDVAAVPDILTALADETNDRPLDHSLTYALIEIADPKATAAGLAHASPRVQRAALAALDQMPGGTLAAADVLPHLTAADPALRDTAWWVAGRHPGWGDDLAGYFRRRLAERLTSDESAELGDRMARSAASPAVQALLAEAVANAKTALPAHRAMSKAGLKKVPEAWLAALTAELRRNHFSGGTLALYTLRALPLKDPPRDVIDALLAFGRNGEEVPNLRLLALAVAGDRVPLDDHLFDALLVPGLADEKHPLVRAAALDAVDRVRFSPAQLARLAAALPAARPTERPRLLDAFGKSKDEAAGRALVAALNAPAVRAALRTEQVKPILDKYPPRVREEAARLYAELDKARSGERDRLEVLLKELPAGDIRRGQVVFNSTKAACAACHKIGYVGGTIGPDLTKIGGIRTERDLLEAVLYPSASFVRSYEPVKVSTADGREFSGILKADAPDAVVLVVAADKEVRIARDDVEAMTPGTVSVMPAGLDQQLTKPELADLIAFLKACK